MYNQREKIVKIASDYLYYNRYNESYKYIINLYNAITPLPRDYKLQPTDNFSTAFVSVVFYNSISCSDLISFESSASLFCVENKEIYTVLATPYIGDIVLFYEGSSSDCTNLPTCCGIVSQLNNETFEIIQGDKNGYVDKNIFAYNDIRISGYVLPKYDSNERIKHEIPNYYIISRLCIRGCYGKGEELKKRLSQLNINFDKVFNEFTDYEKRLLELVN